MRRLDRRKPARYRAHNPESIRAAIVGAILAGVHAISEVRKVAGRAPPSQAH